MMGAKREKICFAFSEPKQLQGWFDKRIQRTVAPSGQLVFSLRNPQHFANLAFAFPGQPKQTAVKALTQRRPASHNVSQRLFEITPRDPAFQLDLDTQLHQNTRRLLIRHEKSVNRREPGCVCFHEASCQRASRALRASIACTHSADVSIIIITSCACMTRSPFTATVTFVFMFEDSARAISARNSRLAGRKTGCKNRASRTIPRMAHRSIPSCVLANSSANGPDTCAASSSMSEPGNNGTPGK